MGSALATTSAGKGPETRPIRLMLVDDSTVARAVLSRMLEADGGFEIGAVAGTAEDAIDALSHVRVDIVLLDLEMPGAGGLKMLPHIIKAARGARVMILSSLAEEGAEQTIAALALGAADTLPKPGTGRFNGRFSEVLLGRLRALGRAVDLEPADCRPAPARPATVIRAPLRAMANGPIEVLAIGASTGGIHSLGAFFHALPERIGVPILVTQHLPAPFMTVFARQLSAPARRKVIVALDAMDLEPDVVLIAPGDAHLTVDISSGSPRVRLDRRAAASGCLPSVDPMFASIGGIYGSAALGVVLSGMGRDGTEGASRLVACGGSVVVQDEPTSAVWGMPRSVAEAGLAAAILPPDKLARRVSARVGDPEWS